MQRIIDALALTTLHSDDLHRTDHIGWRQNTVGLCDFAEGTVSLGGTRVSEPRHELDKRRIQRIQLEDALLLVLRTPCKIGLGIAHNDYS